VGEETEGERVKEIDRPSVGETSNETEREKDRQIDRCRIRVRYE